MCYNFLVMKKQKVAKVLKYTVVFEPSEEGGYVASVPALSGCMSQGETFEETVKMIKDAISGYIAVLREKGQVKKYSWQTMTRQTLKVYESVPL